MPCVESGLRLTDDVAGTARVAMVVCRTLPRREGCVVFKPSERRSVIARGTSRPPQEPSNDAPRIKTKYLREEEESKKRVRTGNSVSGWGATSKRKEGKTAPPNLTTR